MNANRRVFVGNLPPDVNEDDIRQEFASYGNVTNVEIKQKKDCLNENQANRFAFINLDIDTWSLNKCIQEFAEQEWKGRYLKIALAKESFLEQLQRERLEAQAKNQKQNTYSSANQDDSTKQSVLVPPKAQHLPTKQNKSITKVEESSSESSSEDSSESEEEEIKQCNGKTAKTDITPKTNNTFSEPDATLDDNDFVIKSNKHNSFLNPEKLKIPTYGPAIITQKEVSAKKDLTPQSLLAEQKRKQSLLEKKEQYNKQKMLLQKSFLKIDKNPKNKIVFNDNFNNANKNSNDLLNKKSGKRKSALFDDNAEDEDDYNFEQKEQFEGREGQKLLKLQSTYSNDKRFALDSRFLEDDETVEQNTDVVEQVEESLEGEKRHQFEILQNILGEEINHNKDHNKKDITMKSMLRFDPSKPDHNKFLNKPETKNVTKSKALLPQINNKNEQDKVDEPLVSKEKFYSVPKNIKDTIKENTGFSLLSMFGRADTTEETKDVEEYAVSNIEKKKNKISNPLGAQTNPFHYDSSDSEEEINGNIKAKHNSENQNIGQMSSTGVWRENFFFTKGDQRLLDGIKSFMTLSSNESNNVSFSETRRELKKVVKYKILNNLRKTNPFKKKIGGKKMSRKKFKK